MKLKFKKQAYQTRAVEAVADCFKGQPNPAGISYRIAPGMAKADSQGHRQPNLLEESGFKNRDLVPDLPLLKNIQEIQKCQNLPQSGSLVKTKVSSLNLDVEMETGTGKTYCYIKTVFEMNKQFGWTKFIVVVPSIAIREGVYKSQKPVMKNPRRSKRATKLLPKSARNVSAGPENN